MNSRQNIGTVAIGIRLEEEALSLGDIELVEIPCPDMGSALHRCDVDAIWQVEPFQAGALTAGQRKVDDPFTGAAGLPVAGRVATKEFVQEKPEAVTAIQEGLAAAAEELAAGPRGARRHRADLHRRAF